MLHKIKEILGACFLLVIAGAASYSVPVQAADPYIAQIMRVGFNFAPRGWAMTDGQLLQISQNTALFSILGTTFGGDGETTVGLPDLRGRVAMHPGSGPGLTVRRLGEKSGAETATVGGVPLHGHTVRAVDAGRTTDPAVTLLTENPAGALFARDGRERQYQSASPNVSMQSDMIAAAGGGQPHSNIQPYLAVYHVIALTGVYPSRD